MTIAYLINLYPKASHSFIRREIAALEAHGVKVARFTVRRWNEKLVDPEDLAELERTRVLLDAGAIRLLLTTLGMLFTRPGQFFAALKLAIHCGRRGDRGIAWHLIYLAEACWLLRQVTTLNVEHVHSHFGTNSTAVAMLCRVLGGPTYSFTCHGPEEFDKPAALKLNEKIRRAAFVVGVSEFGRSQLCRWSGHQDWSKIQVVHCGVDDAFLKSGANAPAPGRKLGCGGRLAGQKGQLALVAAAAQLAAEGEAFELVLVGDGEMRGAIEAMIANHGLQETIHITGWVSNERVRQELLESRALVLPSFAEGLPVVLMEAMALGRPVISTYVAGIPELVEPGVNGWLVPAGAVEPLVAAMRAALRADDEKLKAMGQAGARKVAARHDASIEAKRLARLFRAAIDASDPTRP